MSLIEEFKAFAMKGNVVDMAVGIITGAAFGKIVSSLVSDVITPPLGILLGGVNFTDLKFTLKAAAGAVPAVTVNYGIFIQSIVDFIIVAFSIFMIVKAMNKVRHAKPADAAPPGPTTEEKLLTEIRDLLKTSR